MPSINEEDVKYTYRVDNVSKYDYNTVFQQTIPGTDLNNNDLLPGIYANVLGIEFTVNNIPTGLSYKIVRVRREQEDKYILGQGLMGVTNIIDVNNIGVYNHIYNEYTAPITDIPGPTDESDNTEAYVNIVKNYPYIVTFKSPEVLFTDSIKPVNGDKIEVVSLTNQVGRNIKNPASPLYERVFVKKIKSTLTRQESGLSPTIAEVKDGGKITDTRVDSADYRFVIDNDGSIKRLINHDNAWKGTCLAIGLKENVPYLRPLNGLVSSQNYVILNYTKDPSKVQYGGNNYTNRINNVYIECGNLSVSNTSLVFGGDTYIGMFEYINAMTYTGHADTGDVTKSELMEVVYIPLESTINVELTHGTSFSKDNADYRLCETVAFGEKAAVFEGAGFGIYPANYTDVYQYNLAYSADPIGKTFTVKPQFFKNNQVNDYRIIVSEKHINNQLIDNWTKFLYNNLIEVNSAYGPINKIITFRNRLFFFQDNAFGIVGFEDRQLLKDNTGLPLVLGTGGVLSNFQYISEKTGKETATWRIFDNIGMIKDICSKIKDDETDIKLIAAWQLEILGYITYTDNTLDKRVCAIELIDGKSTRKVRLYCLNNGRTTDVKVSKQLYTNNPIGIGDIIYIGKFDKKPKAVPLEKDESGHVLKWGKDENILEYWVADYCMVN